MSFRTTEGRRNDICTGFFGFTVIASATFLLTPVSYEQTPKTQL